MNYNHSFDTKETIEKTISAKRWYFSMELAHGVLFKGLDNMEREDTGSVDIYITVLQSPETKRDKAFIGLKLDNIY